MTRRFLRFSLRTFFACTAVLALCLALSVRMISDQRAERRSCDQFLSIGSGKCCHVLVWPKSLYPCGVGLTGIAKTETVPWFLDGCCDAIGINPFERVTEVSIWGSACNNQMLDCIGRFRHIRRLELDLNSVSRNKVDRFQQDRPNCEIVDIKYHLARDL
jgi:hypothetical protein